MTKRNFLHEFGELLEMIDSQNNIAKFMLSSAFMGAVAFILLLYYSLFILHSERAAMLSFAGFIVPFAANYFYHIYLFEARKKKLEEQLPDVLLMASSLPERHGVGKVVSFMAINGGEPIKGEFLKAEAEIAAGSSLENSLKRMAQRNKSLPLSRAVDLMVGSLGSGIDMGSVFRETAEDFMETNSILRERAANTTIEKYTMLIAGGLIVPFVLGVLANMVFGFDFSMMSEIGIGMNPTAREELLSNALLGNIIYIAEYALIASGFVAFQENNIKKTSLYAMFLVPASLAVYFLGRGFY